MAKQTNLERLIQLLRDGQWHSGDELAFHVSWRFGHTVLVARRRGYQIEKRKIARNQFEYRLLMA
jgi:biotin operon repressor